MKILQRITSVLAVLLLLSSMQINAQNVKWQQMGNNKNANFYQVQQDFNNYWQGRRIEKGKGYKPFKRWEAYMAPRVFPSGNMNLPLTEYTNYNQWKVNNPNIISAANWTELGPIGSPSGPLPYTRTGAGRLSFVRFDPTNTNIMYVGAPDGGLWKSTNGGTSWTTNTDFLTIIGCSDLCIDPTNTQIMYLATGDLEGNRNSNGVFKSTDGGATWNTTAGANWPPSNFWKISKMLMNPSNPLNMVVSTNVGIFRTTDGWATSNFQQAGDFKDMEFKPGDANTVYAAGKEFWKSTDNGVTWAQVTTGLPSSSTVSRIALGVTTGNDAYVYALIGKASDNSYLGMYRSTNSGTSFSLRSSTPNLLGYETDGSDAGGQAFYDLAVAVSPTNAEEVTTGGINHWKSVDGGTTWSNLSFWASGEVHADIHEINYLPGSSTTMFSCNDGGIFKSIDNGDNFVDISNNLAISQVVGIGLSANVANTIVAGTQDNGTSIKTATSWANIYGGDGGECFMDPTNNNTVYIQYVQGAFNRSDDGGATSNSITTGLPTGFDFYSTWIMDPVNPNRLYAGGVPTLYTSANKGDLWTALGTPSGTGSIKGIAVAASNPAVIYTIKEDAVSKSINSGAAFSNITGTLPVGSAALSSVTVSNTSPDKVWVTFSGYSAGNKVFKSIDGGTTWTNISTGLPNLPINTIVSVNGSSNDAVYIGADIGIYYLDNSAAGGWAAYNTNLPNVAVRDLEIYYPTNKLRAGTYGRGVWESDLNIIVLPIDLVKFYVTLKGKNDALLQWQTATESNSKGYEIEMAQNNLSSYKYISFVAGKGNSSTLTNYQTVVPNLAPGTYYFRLKMIDLDGKFKYSSTQILKVSADDIVRIYPNPSKDGFVFVELATPANKKINVKITNASGQVVSNKDFTNYVNPLKIKLPAISGEYYIQITTVDGDIMVRKLVTVK
ncbi:T9SS type A sorting domain-containing protein [Ferruginibacter sp.]